MRAVAIAVALLAAALAAFAQAPRNGDEYGGTNHQPTQAEVSEREKAAGLAPSRAQAGADTRSVEQLNRQLLDAEQKDLPRPAGSPASHTRR